MVNTNDVIDPKCLDMDPYQFLEYCKKNNLDKKAVSIITDKQSIFYSLLYDGNHIELANEIDSFINKDVKKASLSDGDFRNNIHIFYYIEDEFIIDFPSDNNFSVNQYHFLIDFLSKLEKFNKDYPEYKQTAMIFTKDDTLFFNDENQLDDLKVQLQRLITNNIDICNENIIGKTLSQNEYESSLMFYTHISDCYDKGSLIEKMNLFYKFYNDDIYKDKFRKMFPNFLYIYKLSLLIQDSSNFSIENISYDDLEDLFINLLKNNINNYKSFEDVPMSFFDENDLVFEDDNLNMFFKVVKSIKNGSDDIYGYNEVDKCFSNKKNLNDLVRLLSLYRIDTLKQEINSVDTNINYSFDVLKQFDFNKRIVGNRIEVAKMYSLKMDLEHLYNKYQLKLKIMEDSMNSDSIDKSGINDKILEVYTKISNIKNRFKSLIGYDMPDSLESINKINGNEEFWTESIKHYQIKKSKLESELNDISNILIKVDSVNKSKEIDDMINSKSSNDIDSYVVSTYNI